jgi:hypothetical protein
MPGLVPGIHVLFYAAKDVDGRVKPGHDESRARLTFIITANHSAGLAEAAAAAAARSAAMRFSTMRTENTEPS